MGVELKKINPACKNVQLIDSNECVSDSLSKINDAIMSSKDAELEMITDMTLNWLQTLTTFNRVSSILLTTALNIQNINNSFRAPYTTVQVLSSKWNTKHFSVFYPQIIEFTDYYNNEAVSLVSIKNWFSDNFPADRFPPSQIVYLYVSLRYTNKFDFIFNGTYIEQCSPTAHSRNTLTCNGCGGDGRNGPCNVDSGGCFNAYSRCSTRFISDSGVFTCVGTISSTYVFDNNYTPSFFYAGQTGRLLINYEIKDIEDKFIARIPILSLINDEIPGNPPTRSWVYFQPREDIFT